VRPRTQTSLALTLLLLGLACPALAEGPAALDEALHKQDLGLEFLRDGRVNDACQFLTWAARLAPQAWEPRYHLAVCLQKQGAPLAQRVKLLEEAEALAPNVYAVARLLAVSKEEAGRFDEAARHYRAALERDPGSLPNRVDLARLLLRLRRDDEALAVLRPLPEETPRVLAMLAELYRRAGKALDEERVLQKLLPIAPDPAPFAARLGVLWLRQARTNEADQMARWMRLRKGPPPLPKAPSSQR
jgi:Flp pilus assembly protein TadD